MPDAKRLTLASPEVQAAKRIFEKYRRRRSVSFDLLFRRFSIGDSYTEIARDAHSSRQAIHQICNLHFAKLISPEQREERRRSRVLRKRIRTALSTGALGAIVKKAKGAGCTVNTVVHELRGARVDVSTRAVFVNGNLCEVRTATSSFRSKHGRREYAQLHVSRATLARVQAIIFSVAIDGYPKRTFIIPRTVLSERYANEPSVRAYIPLEKLPCYNGITQRVDYWLYEDAWSLLKPRE